MPSDTRYNVIACCFAGFLGASFVAFMLWHASIVDRSVAHYLPTHSAR